MSDEADQNWCGLKDDPNVVQCCCNCVHQYPVHYHCGHEPKSPPDTYDRCCCPVQKGWACHNPKMGGHIYDNWPEHSCGCECYEARIPHKIIIPLSKDGVGYVRKRAAIKFRAGGGRVSE